MAYSIKCSDATEHYTAAKLQKLVVQESIAGLLLATTNIKDTLSYPSTR